MILSLEVKMTVRTKYRVDLTLSHKKSGSPRRFCQEGQLDKIAPSRRHLDICKNTKIPNTLQIIPRKFSKNHQKYRHHIAHQAHTAHIAHIKPSVVNGTDSEEFKTHFCLVRIQLFAIFAA